NMKKQMKRADKSGATVALLIGEEELAEGSVTVKYLRNDNEQQRVARNALSAFLAQLALK
ncbi:MAG: His/Gly/Thr/Pro-type tRNA ligase C-terminal domain-containing protein, partial [Shewanella sp.]